MKIPCTTSAGFFILKTNIFSVYCNILKIDQKNNKSTTKTVDKTKLP